MSLEEIKSQVDAAITQLFLVLSNKEHDALDFILRLLRRWINTDVFSQLSDQIRETLTTHKQDERASSPDCTNDDEVSPNTPVPNVRPVPNKQRKRKKTKTILSDPASERDERDSARCGVCGSNGPEGAAHVDTHSGAGVSCRGCRRTFTNLASHALHACSTYTPLNLQQQAVCPYCAQRFSKWSNVRLHMQRSAWCGREGLANHACSHCRLLFSSQALLDSHVTSSHTHKCTKCDEVFATVALMKAHRVTHVNSHKCNKCNETFSTRMLLRKHRKEPHKQVRVKVKNPKVYVCEECGWKTSRSHNLKRHAQCTGHASRSTDPAPLHAPRYQCDRCPAALSSLASLNTHIAAHAEECLYVCDDCQHGFKYKTTLRRHVVTRHGEGGGGGDAAGVQHACSLCPATFRRRDNLRRHQREVHDMARKPRAKARKVAELKGSGSGGGGGEAQFLSLLDVQSGEMFSVPSQYAYNLLMVDGGSGGEAPPALLPQYPHNIVLLTNVQPPTPTLLHP